MCARVCYTGQLLTNLVLKVMNTTNYMLLYIYKGTRYFLKNDKCKSTLISVGGFLRAHLVFDWRAMKFVIAV